MEILRNIIAAIAGWFAARREARELGRKEQQVVDLTAANEARERMAKAAAGPSGRDVTQKELDDGTL